MKTRTMQTIKQAVLATLAYFDLFGVALTRDEIHEHQILGDFAPEQIDLYLKESPLIASHDGFFSLHGEPEWWEEWAEKRGLQKKYFKKVRRYQTWLALCPFVKLIAVCNTLPIGDIHPGSDIDLFVVAQKNRLFLARWWLTALTSLLGIRRHGSKVRERFCLSFYVSEEELNLEKIALKPRDIYLAYWLKTLEPIVGDYKTYETLLRTNPWLSEYFHTLLPRKRYFRKAPPVARVVRHLLEKILDHEKYELKTRNKQLRRIHEKARVLEDRSGTVISDTMLKFHDHDARENIQKMWQSHLDQLL